MMQDMAWYISLVLIALLAVIFMKIITAAPSDSDYAEVARRDYAWRGKLFWLTIFAGIVITVSTLLPWPHAGGSIRQADRLVQAVASQWQWELSEQQFRAGETVHFQVTSKDVNHGFALYNADMVMLGQVQAMPGYTNSLYFTFDKPGDYKVLCLEYCGVAHHNMIAKLTVLPADNQSGE